MKRFSKVVLGILGVLVALLVVGIGVAASLPIASDPFIADEESGTGSVAVEPAYSGLQRAFPPLNQPDDNPTTPEKVELGRQLFFDPVLSADQTLACATCHHPDLGFSDGQATANGRNAATLARNTPTLWNVGFSQVLFWDGRESSLEGQVLTPLTHPDEMAADPNQVIAQLSAIPAYQERFTAAFGPDAITLENVQRALAAFQRSLISQNSPFDRYAAGEVNALTPQQRRGLALFRSGATRCFECHMPPTFALDTFRIVGVASDDPGRAGVTADGAQGAFKVPTLRNIALSAPYMHNGSLATLEEVVQFYADGGGRAHGQTNVDPFVNGFSFSDQEKADLVAFLYALTDESQLPDVPTSALSGLPTVAQVDNPARTEAARINAPASTDETPARSPQTLSVAADESIQSVVDRAQPGDTILVPYREEPYHERVVIDISDLTFQGVPNAEGLYPLFDGRGVLSEAIIASGNNFTVGNLHIINYTDNGILVEGVNNVHFHDLITENTGTYGVYPTKSTGVLIERVKASGVDDAAIYAGQCRDVVIRDSEAHDSVIGVEFENTLNGEAYNNYVHDNTLGFLVVVLPQLNAKISRDTRIYNNLVEANNTPNFAPEGATAGIAPQGVGILLAGADGTEIFNNTIQNHGSAGVAIFSLTAAFDANELDVGPNPENNRVYTNQYANNGYDLNEDLRSLGIPGGDIIWDGSGWDNRFDEPEAQGGFPPVRPASSWPTFLARAYWQLFQLVLSLVG